MVKVFRGEELDDILDGKCPKGFPSAILNVARRKLAMVKAATKLDDLKAPPGNRLHPLIGDRAGQWVIWINDQYRLCFVWSDHGAIDIEITDYH
jgi:proteic killer suppression protein